MKIKTFLIGAFSLYTWEIWYDLYKYYYFNIPDFSKRYGKNSYVLITGGSDGMGREFADILASQGFNLILISRSLEKLQKTASELNDKYPIKVIIHPLDLSKASEQDYTFLSEKFQQLDVSFIINNAGAVNFESAVKLPVDEFNRLVTLDSLSSTLILKFFLPKLEKRESKSAVINVSSSLGACPLPYTGVYSATKAFVRHVSVGFSEEYKGKIDILCFQPSTVISGSVTKSMNPLAIDARDSVNEGIKDLGVKYSSNGHWKHTIFNHVLMSLPERVRLNVLGRAIRMEKKFRGID